MRIAWFSNSPKGTSGYATQTALIAPRLRDLGHDVAILASHGSQAGMDDYLGLPIYPAGNALNWSQEVIGPYSRHFGADITIGFLDAWVHQPGVWGDDVRFVPLYPVDHDPIPPAVAGVVRRSWDSIAYTRFGQAAAAAAGIRSQYAPHAFDPAVFHPMGQEAARQRLGIDDEYFVVGVVAANNDPHPSRKSWQPIFEGFERFYRRHGGRARLYLHTWLDGGVDLRRLVDLYDLHDVVLVCEQTGRRLGYSPEVMRATYGAMDVLLMPSMGEGFGLPLIEAQACGIPVITGDWTAMAELAFSGIKLPKSAATRVMTPAESFQFLPDPDAICEALKVIRDLQRDPANCEKMWQMAVEGAAPYAVDNVIEQYWKPVLQHLEGRVEADKRRRIYEGADLHSGTHYVEFGGGLGDVLQQMYTHGTYNLLGAIGTGSRADVVFVSHNPFCAELLQWHPNAGRLSVRSLPYWDGAEDAQRAAEHGLPRPRPNLQGVFGRPVFYTSPEDDAQLDLLAELVNKTDRSGYVVFAPSAGLTEKDLPDDAVSCVLNAVREAGYAAVLVGRSYDRFGRRERWANYHGRGVINLIDRLSVPGMCRLVQGAAGVVACHSAVNMLASLERVPQLCLYPQSIHRDHYVRRTQWAVGHGQPECVHDLSESWPAYSYGLIRAFLHRMEAPVRDIRDLLRTLPVTCDPVTGEDYTLADWFRADNGYPFYVRAMQVLKPQHLLEIGSHLGFGLAAFGYGADPWLQRVDFVDNESYVPGSRDLARQNAQIALGTGVALHSHQTIGTVPADIRYDVVHIDGDHSYEGALVDLYDVHERRPRYILVDDFTFIGDVARAVRDFSAETGLPFKTWRSYRGWAVFATDAADFALLPEDL